MMNVNFLKPYAKAVVAVGALLVVVGKAIADGGLDGNEFEAIVAAVTALGVYAVPNAE